MQTLNLAVRIHALRLYVTGFVVCSLTQTYVRVITSVQMWKTCTESLAQFTPADQCLHTSSILSLHTSSLESPSSTQSHPHNEVCCHCYPNMRRSEFETVLSLFILAHKGVHAGLCEGYIGHPHQISLLHFALLILIHQLQNLQAIADLL